MEITIRLLGALQRLLVWLSWPFYLIASLRPTPRLPQIKSQIQFLSVVQLAKKIRNKELKSREIVDVYIQRIKDVNPILNAVVQDRFNDAQKEADEIDKFIEENQENIEKIEKEKPLLGVPFTVKESCGLKGMEYSVGCLPRKGTISEDDGKAVKALRNAGAIPLAVTNTPELCMCWETNNLVTGCTRNPYNLHRTAGGSSGGEGALIGSGASIFGIGSDFGGSIRVPAMFNGIFGHKPTPGLVSIDGHFPTSKDAIFPKCLCIGPITRYAEDLPLLLKVMATSNAHLLDLDKKVDLSKIKVFYKESLGFSLVSVPVDREIKNVIRESVKYLKTTYGCPIIKGKFYDLADSAEISSSFILQIKDVPKLKDFIQNGKEEPNLYLEMLKSFFGLSQFSKDCIIFMIYNDVNMFIPKSKFDYYIKKNEKLRNEIMESLQDNGVLIFPTFPIPAFHHNQTHMIASAVLYVFIFNALGFPATHVPLGLNKNGLPIGFQVVAAPNQDRLCLAVAKALEEKFGGWIPPPS